MLSAKPTAKKRDLCSPDGTLAKAIQTTSAVISLRSVYSFNWPVYEKRKNKTLKTRNSKRMLKPYWIHLEVNQLSTSQRYDNLALVDSTSGNSSLARRLPFIDPPVCSNVPDSFGIDLLDYCRHDTEKRNKRLRCSYLKQCIIPQRRTAKGRGSSQKPRIRHFLDRLTDRQHQRGIHE